MERITKFRSGIVLLLFVLLLGFFGFRLFTSQVVNADENANNISSYTTMTRVKAARGDILDRNGNVLVRNRASYDLVFNNYVILSADGTNDHLLNLIHLCRELGFEYNEHFPVTFVRPYEYTLDETDLDWQTYFQAYLADMDLDSDITAPLLMQTLRQSYRIPETWTDEDARRVIGLRYELALRSDVTNLSNYIFIDDTTDAELAAIQELNIPGLMVEATTVREYNTKYAAHILGYVGAMNAEQWEETYKDNDDYEMDAQVGQDGFEEAFEEHLHGVDGWRVDTVDKEGNIIESYYEVAPRAGNNVETTLDLRLQQVAENSLEETIKNLQVAVDEDGDPEDGHDVEGAAVVAMDVKTGEVLVSASYPTYDPNEFFTKYDEMLKDPLLPLYNRALQAEYFPGSMYKPAMVVGAINEGYINSKTIIYDEGIYDEFDDFSAECLIYTNTYGAETHGDVDVYEALKVSCNYFFYKLGEIMPIEAIDENAKKLGLGEPTGVEVYEAPGLRANPENKLKSYDDSDQLWYSADEIMTAIGQSINRFTPMQLCSYASTLANKGVRYKATFLKRVVSADYTDLIVENKPEILSTYEINDEAYMAYSEGMQLVAHDEDGTAYKTFGLDPYPVRVCAKTGTAEHDAGEGVSDHGGIIVYAPADDPEIAIAVYGEQAGHGSSMANIAKDILDAWFFNADIPGDVVTAENRVS